jgi:hypothetical protein
MGGKELTKASRLFRRKKFSEVIRLLEPQVFRFRQNARFYYLLGISYLYTGDISGARTYLERVIQLEPRNSDARNALAAVHLKMNRNDEAILNWLRVLEDEPKNGIARKGLELLRRTASEPGQLEDFLESKRFFSLLPSEGFTVPPVLIVLVVLVFLLPLGLYLFPRAQDILPSRTEEREPEVTSLEVSEDAGVVAFSGSYRIMLTEEEIRETFESIKQYFNQRRDNLAQREINRILLSNASQEVKDKVSTIAGYLNPPDFQTFTDNFTYSEVISDPPLYEDCYVRWKGRASNLEITETEVRFDFLVGYHDSKTLEGIVPVSFPFAVSVEQGQPVEVLGRIVLEAGLGLVGVSLRPIYTEEE